LNSEKSKRLEATTQDRRLPYAAPEVLELGDLAELTAYTISVRA
jgi:hypothetical protein